MAHRDLKPSNLLIFNNGTLRISDFGCARRFDPQSPRPCSELDINDPSGLALPVDSGQQRSPRVTDTCGTEAFFCPEACQGNGKDYDVRAADVWAAGLCLDCFLLGELPFDLRLPPEEMFSAIAALDTSQAPPALNLGMSESSRALSDFRARLLQKDPSKRISASNASTHAWLDLVQKNSS